LAHHILLERTFLALIYEYYELYCSAETSSLQLVSELVFDLKSFLFYILWNGDFNLDDDLIVGKE